MAALCGELGPGAAPALKVLDLSSNRIKDDGVSHLFKALARGAAPALESLNLLDSPIGRKGTNALCSAFKRGAVPELKRLDVELRLDTCQTGAQAEKMRLKWTQALVDALPPRECAWENGLRIT